MSFLKRIVNGKNAAKSSSETEMSKRVNESIDQLILTENLIEKKILKLEKDIDQQIRVAKQMVMGGNKRAAMKALKTKKRLESQLNQLDKTLINLEYQRDMLESAQTNKKILETMRVASEAMKRANESMTNEDVDELRDALSEQNQMMQEMSSAFTSIRDIHDVDESELLRELEQYKEEKDLKLPEVSNSKIEKSDEDGENQLKQLETWAI